ncbi:MAG: diacylglycerol/lipid kinase family protein [Candidatus Hodarchaeales archaeon]|jgi:YegS/Rv2252/BmrU family lipid kinase
MKELFLIVNTTAAGGRVGKIWEKELKPLLDSRFEYDFDFTGHIGHALELAKQKANAGYKLICAVGGDGTVNEVVNGILKAEKSSTFCAFTVGTGNDVAATFGIPEGDITKIIESLENGLDKQFDVGYCEKADRYFGGVASMGFDAEVADRTNKGEKKRVGTGNYRFAIFTTILKFKPYEIIIEPSEGEPVTGKRMLVAIGNGKRYGGGMHICPDANPLDGTFYGTTLKKISRFSLLRLFPMTYDGSHISHKAVETFKGNKIKVDSPNKPCLYQVDGEIQGFLPETFSVKPLLLTVRVPKPFAPYSEIWKQKLSEKKKQDFDNII